MSRSERGIAAVIGFGFLGEDDFLWARCCITDAGRGEVYICPRCSESGDVTVTNSQRAAAG